MRRGDGCVVGEREGPPVVVPVAVKRGEGRKEKRKREMYVW